MKHKITATAPTSYQWKSLTLFGMKIKKLGNGSYTSTQEFETEEEAKEFLTHRAEAYAETEEELTNYLQQVENTSTLQLDAVTAYIREIEEEEDYSFYTYYDSEAGKQDVKFNTEKEIKAYIENFGYNVDSDGEVYLNDKPILLYKSTEGGIIWEKIKYKVNAKHYTANSDFFVNGVCYGVTYYPDSFTEETWENEAEKVKKELLDMIKNDVGEALDIDSFNENFATIESYLNNVWP